MEFNISEIVSLIVVSAAGVITSVIIPLFVNLGIRKFFRKKINNFFDENDNKKIQKELKEIKKEILEMRGKIK